MKKCRDFERIELESSLNAMLFGVFFLFVAMLSSTMIYLGKVYSASLAAFLPQANLYIGYLGNITELGLFPLFGICFLVAILIAKNPLERKEGAQKNL